MTCSIGTNRSPSGISMKRGKQRRHLHAREAPFSAGWVANESREVEREGGDVRERVRRVDGERGEDREDAFAEEFAEVLAIVGVELGPTDEPHALLLERGTEFLHPERVRAAVELRHAFHDAGELLLGRRSLGRSGADARFPLFLEARDTHLEELVQVGTEDREELHPLEEPIRCVLGQARAHGR